MKEQTVSLLQSDYPLYVLLTGAALSVIAAMIYTATPAGAAVARRISAACEQVRIQRAERRLAAAAAAYLRDIGVADRVRHWRGEEEPSVSWFYVGELPHDCSDLKRVFYDSADVEYAVPMLPSATFPSVDSAMIRVVWNRSVVKRNHALKGKEHTK